MLKTGPMLRLKSGRADGTREADAVLALFIQDSPSLFRHVQASRCHIGDKPICTK
jgi:hypothetical protein